MEDSATLWGMKARLRPSFAQPFVLCEAPMRYNVRLSCQATELNASILMLQETDLPDVVEALVDPRAHEAAPRRI